ncbi:signal transduction histidine kinase [Saccharothrix tamanrassetensis]|uniref:histidine kinase n=1 Tax=Saccharothrix tamanrassetensis TaxID=1051531 RepID=A0A841CJH5_9PSEU|nr:sensor histidine kinase [Saccharothrix tamanrassetensis]MBB5957449.1 signal transduction histidine kinase [Saccharothrix tamanrassetensis]
MDIRRFLGTPAPWRAWLYVATGALVGFPTLFAVVVLTGLGMALSPVLVGLPILAALGLSGLVVGAVERRRLGLLGDVPPRSPHRTLRNTGVREWARTRAGEAATGREFAYTVLFATGLWLLDYVAAVVPVVSLLLLGAPVAYALSDGDAVYLGFALASWGSALLVAAVAVPALLLGACLVAGVARLHARVARALLTGPDGEPDDDMESIRSNGRLLDAFDAERRRIERDLHDGAQQRLVALTMLLDLARMRAGELPGLDRELADLLARAHADATTTLAELRELVQGIHPHVLGERGLPAAVDELVTRHPTSVRVRLPGLGRLPSTVESTAFFVVSEALTNVAKHSAGQAWVHGHLAGDLLVVEVGDAGAGGADPERGSGLRGIADRVAAVGGRAMLSSPPGGPTVVRVEIPCLPGEVVRP